MVIFQSDHSDVEELSDSDSENKERTEKEVVQCTSEGLSSSVQLSQQQSSGKSCIPKSSFFLSTGTISKVQRRQEKETSDHFS